MHKTTGPLKWGFFGAGKITQDFVKALHLLPKTDHLPVGIAARSEVRAKEFAVAHDIPKSYGSYSELLLDSDNDIDVIYIGTVNSEHFHQAKLALSHGKHVLCEKPLSVNAMQVKELIQHARTCDRFLMEGFWTMFFPAYEAFKSQYQLGAIGDLKQLLFIVGNKFGHMDRFRKLELGGGAMLNHGVYGLAFANEFLGVANRIVASAHLSPDGVDISNSVTLFYSEGEKQGSFVVDSRVKMPSQLHLIGTEGTLTLEYPFWAPTAYTGPNGKCQYELPRCSPDLKFNYINAQGFIYEAEEVRRCIRNGLRESELMPLAASERIYEMSDVIRKQLKVSFPADQE